MAKPAISDIAHGVESWDAVINSAWAILRDNPMPVKEYNNATGLPAASSFDRCIAFKELETGEWFFQFSDGTSWVLSKGREWVKVFTVGETIGVDKIGRWHSNEGATARVDFVLPAAAKGLAYGFIVQDADGIRVTAGAGDTIRIEGSVSGAAGRIDSTTIGSTVFLIAINATEWIAVSMLGTWTVT